MKKRFSKNKISSQNGQAALELAFVFSMLIILLFSMVNFGIIFHTRNIATYAAFMAARSYQVTGDLQRDPHFGPKELTPNLSAYGSMRSKVDMKEQNLFLDLKTAPTYQVAEDIFTCAIPWMQVPETDKDRKILGNDNIRKNSPYAKCYEGERKYETMNVGDRVRFQSFGEADDGISTKGVALNSVKGAYSEKGRDPLRYGILSMRYPKYAVFNALNLFSQKKSGYLGADIVYVPVLLNPGLSSDFEEADPKKQKNFDDEEDGKK